jgi:proteasome lid subunit RPN8/RPN11
MFPQVQFYDYTKVLGRKTAQYPNYHLTFSKADGNDSDVAEALMQGMSVVAVYDQIPEGVPSADETDLRFLDPKGTMLGLKAKGRAKKDYSGFVIRIKATA